MNGLLQCAHNVWTLKAGDATPLGWLITFGYFYTILLIFYMLRKLRRFSPDRRRLLIQFWLVVVAVYILLGINKQLDLHTFVTATGRCMAKLEGWYRDRRSVQLTVFLAGLSLGLMLLMGFIYYFRRIVSRCMLAITGLGISGLYILFRAVSFHHVDRAFSLTFLDFKIHSLLELTGILLVALNALSLAFQRVRREPAITN